MLATSKGEDFARRILENTGPAPLFAFAGGTDRAAGRFGDKEPNARGAHEVAPRRASVLYGYGARRELEDAGAEFLMPPVADPGEWLLRGYH